MRMPSDPIFIVGTGGHARVVLATARAAGVAVEAFVSNDATQIGGSIAGIKVVGPDAEVLRRGAAAILGIGSNATRRALAQRFDCRWAWLKHPTAHLADGIEPGEGTVIFAGAVVQTGVALGRHVIVNTGATIDHDCVVHDYTHMAPGTNVAGAVTIGEGALLGIGSCVVPNRSIGAWSTVGAGAAVIHDVRENMVVSGVPAHEHEPTK